MRAQRRAVIPLVIGLGAGLVLAPALGHGAADAAKRRTRTSVCLGDAALANTTAIIRVHNLGTSPATVTETKRNSVGSEIEAPTTLTIPPKGSIRRLADAGMAVTEYASRDKLIVDAYLAFTGGSTPDLWHHWQIRCT